MIQEYTTYVVLTLVCNHRNVNLRKVLHREISLPPLFVPGMYIAFGGHWIEVKYITWEADSRMLLLDGRETLYCHSPDSTVLNGSATVRAFFDQHLQSYLEHGWSLGNPSNPKSEEP